MTSCTEMSFFPTNFMLQTNSNEEEEEDPNSNHHHHNHNHNHHDLHNNHPPISLSPFFPPCTTTSHHHDFHGVAGSVLGKRSNMSFSGGNGIELASGCDHHHHHHQEGNMGEDDLSDDGSQLGGEKKRRLNLEQVKTLEKNFELGNKLEPERKMQLARALGLQPRQIAIWFQNRRARWKTKQLEKDYDLLKRQFDALKADNDALQSQNHKLQAQVLAFKTGEDHNHQHNHFQTDQSINLNKLLETDQESESSSDVVIMKLDISMMPNSSSSAAEPAGGTINSSSTRINLFPPVPAAINHHQQQQLFQQHGGPSPNAEQLHHCSTKINDPNPMPVKEETFTNMFCGIDVDQTGFWPWLEPQHFN